MPDGITDVRRWRLVPFPPVVGALWPHHLTGARRGAWEVDCCVAGLPTVLPPVDDGLGHGGGEDGAIDVSETFCGQDQDCMRRVS